MIAHFKILNLPVRVESNSEKFLHDVGRIFHYFKVTGTNVDTNNGTSFHVSIDRTSTISRGKDTLYRSSDYRYVLEYLEYKIYTLLIDRLNDYYLIHAGVMAHNNKAVVIPACSGGGKTTLIAGLLKKGFRYLTDEIAIIHPHTLEVYPFPKPLNMKIGSLSLFDSFQPEMEVINKNDVAIADKIHHVFVRSRSIHALDDPLPVSNIIFVRYEPNEKSTLTPISRANAIFKIATCSFNHFRFKQRGVDILDRLVRRCACYQLAFTDVAEAANLMKRLETFRSN